MPTHDEIARFKTEYKKLPPEAQQAFRRVVAQFVADLKAGSALRPSLRIKRLSGHRGLWEISFGPDLRATFEYASAQHVIWRRIGKHEIFDDP